MRDVLGNHLKDRSFRLVHWLSTALSVRETSQESINSERKSYLDCSSDTLVRGGNVEGWHVGCRHWGVGSDGRMWNLLEKTQCKRGDISQRKWKIRSSSRRWTNQTSWRRSGTENTHLDTGTPNLKRKSRRFSWRIRRVSSTTSWLISGCRWSDKRLLVHVRKFHFPHHVEPRVTLHSPREESFPIPLKNIDVSRTTHTNLDVKQERRIDDYWNIDGSRDLSDSWTGFTEFILFEEKPPDGYMWSGRRLTSQGQIIYGQNTGRNREEMHSWRRGKSGHMKSQNSILPENYEEFISLTLRTRNSKKPSRMLARNWKHQWVRLCLARHARKASMWWLVVNPMWSNQNLRVFCKPVNPQDCVWEILPNYHEDHIAGKEDNSLQHCNLYTNLFLCPKPWKFLQQRLQLTRNGKNWKRFRRGTWRKSEVRKKWSMKQGRRVQKFILPHWWTSVI